MKFKLLFIFSILSVTLTTAQVDSVKFNLAYLEHYWTDTRDIIVSPVGWDKKDWGRFGIFAGTTGVLLFIDKPVRDFFLQNRTGSLDNFSAKFLDPFGNIYSGMIAAGFFGIGAVSKNKKLEATGLMALESFAIGSLLARIPKYAFGRVRPDAWWGPSPFEWNGPFGGASFPSGHTVAAFSVASVFATQYKQTVWVPVIAYSLATAAGISRIYENRHWTSDVFAGAILGIITGKFICKSYRSEKYSFTPCFRGRTKGVTFVFKI